MNYLILHRKAGGEGIIKIQSNHDGKLDTAAISQQTAYHLRIGSAGIKIPCRFSGQSQLENAIVFPVRDISHA